MDNFALAEGRGRELLLSLLEQGTVTDIEFTKGKYEAVDCNYTSNGYKVSAEIKVRNERYKDYSTHLMEVSKLNNMFKYNRENNRDVGVYVNFFGDNWCYMYQIHRLINLIPEDKLLHRTSAEYNGYTNKSVIHIPTDLAQIYYREDSNSEWVLTNK